MSNRRVIRTPRHIKPPKAAFLSGFNEIRKKAPDKKLYTVKPDQVCVNMKKVTLDKVLDVLENDTNEVFVDEELAQCALKPLNKMLELAAK